MGSTSSAVDTLDRLAVQLTGIQEAAKQLRELGPYQDAIDRLKTEHETLLALRRKTAESLDRADADLAKLKADAERFKASVVAEIDGLKKQAKQDVDELMRDAKQRATDELSRQQFQKKATFDKLTEDIASATRRLEQIQNDIAMAEKASVQAEKKAADSRSNLESIQAQLRRLAGVS